MAESGFDYIMTVYKRLIFSDVFFHWHFHSLCWLFLQVLQISSKATEDEIKKRFRQVNFKPSKLNQDWMDFIKLDEIRGLSSSI